MTILPALLAAVVLGGAHIPVQVYFGENVNVTCIADTQVVGKEGEPLCLAYKTTSFYAGLGVYFHDDGYVMGVKSDPGSFYPLPDDERDRFQENGLLPKPLPAYSPSPKDYISGLSLWALIGGAFALYALDRILTRLYRQFRPASTPPQPGPE
ncbi:MAG TPA: hypothetical protein VGK67_18160 [Myxococcales bacterium]|jgi:hypothetical protein